MPENDLTPKTLRETMLCRDAFLRGVLWALPDISCDQYRATKIEAAERYPVPMIDVPRVVGDLAANGVQYKIDKTETGMRSLFVRGAFTDGVWRNALHVPHVIDESRAALIAALVADPTERRPVTE